MAFCSNPLMTWAAEWNQPLDGDDDEEEEARMKHTQSHALFDNLVYEKMPRVVLVSMWEVQMEMGEGQQQEKKRAQTYVEEQ